MPLCVNCAESEGWLMNVVIIFILYTDFYFNRILLYLAFNMLHNLTSR